VVECKHVDGLSWGSFISGKDRIMRWYSFAGIYGPTVFGWRYVEKVSE
jgi:hypothetical protein